MRSGITPDSKVSAARAQGVLHAAQLCCCTASYSPAQVFPWQPTQGTRYDVMSRVNRYTGQTGSVLTLTVGTLGNQGVGEGQGANPVCMPSQAAHLLEVASRTCQQQPDDTVHPA